MQWLEPQKAPGFYLLMKQSDFAPKPLFVLRGKSLFNEGKNSFVKVTELELSTAKIAVVEYMLDSDIDVEEETPPLA